jgi:anti-sigma factor RsiW
MIDRRLDRLMNQEIDGANSPAESAMLQKALETSGEARARYESLRAAQEILRGAEGPAPGPEFKDGVLAAVRRNARPAAPDRFSWRPAAFGPLRLKYALFFGLGLGLGLLILVVFRNRTIDAGFDARQLVGTVAEARSLRPAGDLRFDQGLVSQDLRLRYGDGCLVAEVSGSAAGDVELVLTFDKDRLSFDALRQTRGEQGGVTIEPGRLEIRTAGSHGYVLVFNVKGGLPLALNYRVGAGGSAVFTRDLSVTAEDVR